VTVVNSELIGVGANIIEERTIGENSVIGAGAVVINDIGDGQTVVGVPAKPIKCHGEND
jgi:serine acetyltransferase